MAVLYRKYRPQNFTEVLNQKPIIQTLKNQVLSGKVAHAYLFTGSRGVGKTSVARILAKAVNCNSSSEKEKPCGECENCKAISAGAFLDLIEIDAASNTGVDNIRELIEHIKFSPSVGKFKVFIIDEVHMLSKGAFNALLKTLEEPPKHAIFILATTEINKVPATIISRTQRFDFKALSAEDLMGHLVKISKEENLNFSNEVLDLVAQNSEGSVRDALSLFEKITTLGNSASIEECRQLLGITDLAVCEELLEIIALGNFESLPEFFSELGEKGVDYIIFNRDFLEYLRKVLIYQASGGAITGSLGGAHEEKLKSLANKFTISDLIFTIRLFLKSYKDLPASPSGEIPLLLAAIEASLKKKRNLASPISETGEEKLKKKTEDKTSNNLSQPAEIASTAIVYDEITLQEAQEVWPKIINKIKQINGPLASMLKNCLVKNVAPGKVFLSVKFKFDKQRIEDNKNTSLISSVFEEMTGKKLGITAHVMEQQGQEVLGTAEAITEALKVFGGELVE